MKFKATRESYMGTFGGRNRKGEMLELKYNLKNKQKVAYIRLWTSASNIAPRFP